MALRQSHARHRPRAERRASSGQLRNSSRAWMPTTSYIRRLAQQVAFLNDHPDAVCWERERGSNHGGKRRWHGLFRQLAERDALATSSTTRNASWMHHSRPSDRHVSRRTLVRTNTHNTGTIPTAPLPEDHASTGCDGWSPVCAAKLPKSCSMERCMPTLRLSRTHANYSVDAFFTTTSKRCVVP